MKRRSFLASMLAASTAPYVITSAGVLMPARHVIAPPRYGSPCADVTYDDNADGGFTINGAGMYAISAVTFERTGELYLADKPIMTAFSFQPGVELQMQGIHMLRPGDVLRPSKNLSFKITRLA